MIFEQSKSPGLIETPFCRCIEVRREARRLVNLLNSGAVVVRLRRGTSGTRHTAGHATFGTSAVELGLEDKLAYIL